MNPYPKLEHSKLEITADKFCIQIDEKRICFRNKMLIILPIILAIWSSLIFAWEYNTKNNQIDELRKKNCIDRELTTNNMQLNIAIDEVNKFNRRSFLWIFKIDWENEKRSLCNWFESLSLQKNISAINMKNS